MTDFGGLSIDGSVVTPDDGEWDQARSAWNLSADQHPAAVAFVESPTDVVATVRFAASNGLHVSGQGPDTERSPSSRSTTRSWSRPNGCGASRSTPTHRRPGSKPVSWSPS